jgi:hypothetical protein
MSLKGRPSRGAVGVFLVLCSFLAFADDNGKCRLSGSYGYLYNGTAYPGNVAVPLTETGFFEVRNGRFSGEGTLAFYFPTFNGLGPLALLIREEQTHGIVTEDPMIRCAGSVDFLATSTVIETSDPDLVPVGANLFVNEPRSIAYTISGKRNEVVDVVSTSLGTIASGTARKQSREDDD